MDDPARAVLAAVDRRELIDLASALIRIPSFKTEETAVARFLDAFFRERGYQVDLQEIEPGRLQTIATLRGTGGGAHLMLNGHTDINALTRRWRRDPWTPSLEGDRLYGHGVQNMKGGLASIIVAAEAIRRSGLRLPGDLVVACVAGETQGGEGTHYLMQSGLRTDAAVVAEPFGADNLVTVHSGIVHLAIHTYGVTGHIGRLEGTVNAVQTMTAVIEALQHVRFRHTPRSDLPAFPRLNVGGILGGRGQDYVLV
jgi:acetylornithine deacetylase